MPKKAHHKPRPLIDLTPRRFACAVSMACPALLEDEAGDKFIIIGKVRDPQSAGLRGRVGPDEMAVEIARDLVLGAIQSRKAK